ncbi:putative uncharacterized protein C5orf58 [Dipodomys merriami]|uniref:putative uncharacterized protein C5orf58 n=1 Tax=Dipodomys merriami TaxID=94247 RepID=UPI0038557EC5
MSGVRGPRENERGHEAVDHKQKVETIIKNLKTISKEVRRMKEHAQLLLCDLTVQLEQPLKIKHIKEPKEPNNSV